MFDRDKITESINKESLLPPLKIIIFVSSAHIPMRARGIVRSILGENEVLESEINTTTTPHVIITDIIVRELGFLSVLKNRKRNDDKETINKTISPLKGLQLRLEAESARAKLTYVREFYTLGAMNRLRKSKPDLIIDISDVAELHEVVVHEAKIGVLSIETIRDEKVGSIQSVLTTDSREILLTREVVNDDDDRRITTVKRTLLIESVMKIAEKARYLAHSH